MSRVEIYVLVLAINCAVGAALFMAEQMSMSKRIRKIEDRLRGRAS